MSDPTKTSKGTPSSALDSLIGEARSPGGLEPNIDEAAFQALEDEIVARMSRESQTGQIRDGRSSLVDEVRKPTPLHARRARIYQIGAVVLAAAAAVALVIKKDPATSPVAPADTISAAQGDYTGGALRPTEGPGEVRVGGHAVSAGHVLRAGDVVEVDGTRAVLERARKVTWLLERNTQASATPGTLGTLGTPELAVGGARAHVKTAGETLVLDLEDGVIEAQVTPVPSGEAFAVDVAAGSKLVRVAVHGTHLRVARAGTRVAIDLSEGVVSIGVPPRTGSTYGTLVTAPSHVEFDASNLEGTLKIDHAPTSVRTPVSLTQAPAPVAARANVPPTHRGESAAATEVAPPVTAPATVPRPSSMPHAAVDPSKAPGTKVENGKPAGSARDVIAAAVRDCAAARSRPENVRVTVTSSLKLKISPAGAVDVAQFDPPLLPEIQTCAAATIYKAKLEESAGGAVTIPIDFTY